MSDDLDPRQVSTPAEAPVPPISVPLVSKRRERALLFQKLQHAIPAGALLYAGIQGLLAHRHGLELSLALGEIAFSLLLLRSLATEIRAARHGREAPAPAHHGVDWSEILAAGVLAAEALEHWHTRGHFPRPIALLALVTLVLGLSHDRLAAYNLQRRALRIDDDGVHLGGRFLDAFPPPGTTSCAST